MRVFINAGHGGKDGGATGNGLKEKDLTLKIAKRIADRLKNEYEGVTIKLFRNNDTFYSLNQITNESNKWKADLFVSIHINAGGGTGFESYVYNGGISDKTLSNQMTIHNEIMEQLQDYGVTNRGKKKANFAVLRQTVAPALLTENLFIDTKKDADLLKKSKFLDSVAKGHVIGIAKALKLKKKKHSATGTYYRVVTGSFKEKSNADDRVKALKAKGFDSFIDVYKK